MPRPVCDPPANDSPFTPAQEARIRELIAEKLEAFELRRLEAHRASLQSILAAFQAPKTKNEWGGALGATDPEDFWRAPKPRGDGEGGRSDG